MDNSNSHRNNLHNKQNNRPNPNLHIHHNPNLAQIMKTKYCPKCKSTNIEYKPSVGESVLGFIATHK